MALTPQSNQITNATAVAFCNTKVRPMADKLAQTYYQAKQIVAVWNAQNLASLLPPGDTTDVVADGAFTDGRNPISPDMAYGIILQAQAFITTMEANNSANLAAILGVAVNTNP